MNFTEVSIEDFQFNPFAEIGSDWMLITAGDEENFNTMTASWVVLVFFGERMLLRPTYVHSAIPENLLKKNDYFTISFFTPEFKEALNICGTLSGRKTDKISKAKLTPYVIDGTTAFEEANKILVCKKLYKDTMPPENFIDKENGEKWYPDKDYHFMYIAEIKKIFVKA